ncbi:MAG: hypothetical protein ACC707_11555 [Thiohalomonadales bacterium]
MLVTPIKDLGIVMKVFARIVAILLITHVFVISFAHAKIRKCVLNNGHVVYTDVGCPEQVAKKLSKAQLALNPFAGMSDIERNIAITKRNSHWEKASKKVCLDNIENYAKTLQPEFSELIVKKQHKLVTRSQDQDNVEYVHRISFFFMANGREWESSGNCHATKQANAWDTSYRRVTTGIPYISARKSRLENKKNKGLANNSTDMSQNSVEDLAAKKSYK